MFPVPRPVQGHLPSTLIRTTRLMSPSSRGSVCHSSRRDPLSCYGAVLIPGGPCAMNIGPGPSGSGSSRRRALPSLPASSAGRYTTGSRTPLGVSVTPPAATHWSVPRPGVEGSPGISRPFPPTTEGGAAHPGNADALLELSGAWPLVTRALLWRTPFGLPQPHKPQPHKPKSLAANAEGQAPGPGDCSVRLSS